MQRFVRDHKKQPVKTAAFVPLTFAAGEAYQFDWSEEEVEIGGVVQRVKAAHFRLTHSRQPFVMVFPRETQEMVFAAHDAAFHYWGGVPRQGIYDNLKTGVDQVLDGKERRFNPRFLALMSHYVIEPVACTRITSYNVCYTKLLRIPERLNYLIDFFDNGLCEISILIHGAHVFAAKTETIWIHFKLVSYKSNHSFKTIVA